MGTRTELIPSRVIAEVLFNLGFPTSGVKVSYNSRSGVTSATVSQDIEAMVVVKRDEIARASGRKGYPFRVVTGGVTTVITNKR